MGSHPIPHVCGGANRRLTTTHDAAARLAIASSPRSTGETSTKMHMYSTQLGTSETPQWPCVGVNVAPTNLSSCGLSGPHMSDKYDSGARVVARNPGHTHHVITAGNIKLWMGVTANGMVDI